MLCRLGQLMYDTRVLATNMINPKNVTHVSLSIALRLVAHRMTLSQNQEHRREMTPIETKTSTQLFPSTQAKRSGPQYDERRRLPASHGTKVVVRETLETGVLSNPKRPRTQTQTATTKRDVTTAMKRIIQ